jgi:hypothetical protein
LNTPAIEKESVGRRKLPLFIDLTLGSTIILPFGALIWTENFWFFPTEEITWVTASFRNATTVVCCPTATATTFLRASGFGDAGVRSNEIAGIKVEGLTSSIGGYSAATSVTGSTNETATIDIAEIIIDLFIIPSAHVLVPTTIPEVL